MARNSEITFSEFDPFKLATEFTKNGQFTKDGQTVHTFKSASGDRVEKWSWKEDIGSGAFGTVWKEECLQTAQFRAVKRISLTQMRNTAEMKAMTKMNPHSQYFVQFLGWFRDKENVYLAMEFMSGDLEGLVMDDKDLTEYDVKQVTTQLVDGLAIMHKHNFCHRDLKPQNILIANWFPIRVKIADFGITKQTDDHTGLRTFAGTLDYLAPEANDHLDIDRDSSEYTTAVDIWSLGCVVYKMFTRDTPFSTKSGQQGMLTRYVRGQITFPESKLALKASSTAIAFIKNLMMPKPGDRLTAELAKTQVWLKDDPTNNDTWDQPQMSSMYNRVRGPQARLDPAKAAQLGRALLVATSTGSLETVTYLLEKGADPNAEDSTGATALHRAAQSGYLAIARALIKEGAYVSVLEYPMQYTPLHWAAQESHFEMVKLLLDNGADPEAVNLDGYTPVHCSAKNGKRDIMESLLKKGSDVPRLKAIKESALMIAASEGQVEIAQALLERGADPRWNDNEALETALHIAAQGQSEEMIETLLWYDADLTARDANGLTPLHRACKTGSLEAAKVLLKKGASASEITTDKSTPLILAVQADNLEMMQLLLENDADLMAKDAGGSLALHWAADKGSPTVVEFLASHSPRAIRGVNDSQATVLHSGASSGDFDTVEYLLKQRGTDILARDSTHKTALHIAVEARSDPFDSVNLLMAKGLKISEKDSYGCTVLHRAVQGGYLEVVRLLLNRGASITEKAANGATPFIMAANTAKCRIEILQLLLDKGSNVMEKDNRGETALHKAATHGQLEIVKFLLKKGADIRAETDDIKATPIAKAASKKDLKMVQFFLDNGGQDPADVSGVETALHAAASCGSRELTLLLLRNGADIEAKNAQGHIAFELAAQHKHKETVELLLDWKNGDMSTEAMDFSPEEVIKEKKTLVEAARTGDLDTFKLLIDQGADISAKDSEGSTALHLAAQHGFIDAARLLREKGADITERNGRGFAPLHLAVEFGQFEIVKFFIDDWNANPNARSVRGITPVLMGVHCGYVSIVEYLISKGSDIRAPSLSNMRTITLAAQNGDPAMFELMLRWGADPVWAGTRGSTALHEAARYGRMEIMQQLLEFERIQIEAVNDDNLTPISLAAENGHLDVLRLLVEEATKRKADPGYVRLSIPLSEALAKADINGHWEVVDYLNAILDVYYKYDQFVGSAGPLQPSGEDQSIAEDTTPAEDTASAEDAILAKDVTLVEEHPMLVGNKNPVEEGADPMRGETLVNNTGLEWNAVLAKEAKIIDDSIFVEEVIPLKDMDEAILARPVKYMEEPIVEAKSKDTTLIKEVEDIIFVVEKDQEPGTVDIVLPRHEVTLDAEEEAQVKSVEGEVYEAKVQEMAVEILEKPRLQYHVWILILLLGVCSEFSR